jgi:predicted nicotinamide N-methyase
VNPPPPRAPFDPRAFILQHTRLQQPSLVPELRLYLADEVTPIWRMTEEALEAIGLPPPFWAFAWAGGQALARYLLDRPHEVLGKTVLDLATGSGVAALAAMKSGARAALGSDLDTFSGAALALNGAANGLSVDFTQNDLLASPPPRADVILAGDVFYEKPLADRVLPWLAQAQAKGARVLMGDPGRTYFPKTGLLRLADYRIATSRELEDQEVKKTGVFTWPSP